MAYYVRRDANFAAHGMVKSASSSVCNDHTDIRTCAKVVVSDMCNWSCSVINLKQPREAVYIMELDEWINKCMCDCVSNLVKHCYIKEMEEGKINNGMCDCTYISSSKSRYLEWSMRGRSSGEANRVFAKQNFLGGSFSLPVLLPGVDCFSPTN